MARRKSPRKTVAPTSAAAFLKARKAGEPVEQKPIPPTWVGRIREYTPAAVEARVLAWVREHTRPDDAFGALVSWPDLNRRWYSLGRKERLPLEVVPADYARAMTALYGPPLSDGWTWGGCSMVPLEYSAGLGAEIEEDEAAYHAEMHAAAAARGGGIGALYDAYDASLGGPM